MLKIFHQKELMSIEKSLKETLSFLFKLYK